MRRYGSAQSIWVLDTYTGRIGAIALVAVNAFTDYTAIDVAGGMLEGCENILGDDVGREGGSVRSGVGADIPLTWRGEISA